ncbi:MAG: hypothetical protein HW391_1171 [Chloroflexi bacterium]|nr:hypothetical protein [Chloroflexota bacterium]
MTEILTESFCERCGTRYTFESVAPRQRRLGGMRVLGRGLKNFVLSDNASLDESFASARSDADREASAHQLDAFHQTFNFCMSCRQYTCSNCWNRADARCLSCAPIAAPDVLQIPVAELDPERLLRFVAAPAAEVVPSAATDAAPAVPAWPAEDAAEAAVEVEPVAQVEAEVQAGAEVEADVQVEAEAVAEAGGVFGLEPGASLDDAIAAYEASFDEEGRAAGPGIDVVAQPAWPGPVLEEPPAAEVAAPLEPADAVRAVDIVAVPPPEVEPEVAPAIGAAAPEPVAPPPAAPAPSPSDGPSATPQWPVGPRWPTGAPSRQAPATPAPPPAGDALTAIMARKASDAMWAVSSADLVQAPLLPQSQPVAAVQPCINCGISLSGSARFCRRCGTPQGA